MPDIIVKGKALIGNKLKNGTFKVTPNGIEEIREGEPQYFGTIIPAPVNFHTHLGDSFIGEEPIGTLPEIVGPNGFKMRHLNSTDQSKISRGMLRSIDFMNKLGLYAFIDFREQGLKGFELIPEFRGIKGIFLSRPSNLDEANILIRRSWGFAMSSLSDHDFSFLLKLREIAMNNGKLFAIHFSENVRENLDMLLQLSPDFIIHGIEATEDEIRTISEKGIYWVITPRSNIFYGKRPDYSKLFKNKAHLLLGTDNAFVTEPDIFSEIDFLYRYQRGIYRISPSQIIEMSITRPREFFKRKGINFGRERYILFLEEVDEFQIITRAHMYDYIVLDI